MKQTKSAIVDAAALPISIIIVGVGDANFDAMEELDGDEVRVTSFDGRVASRDIVQFVPFRNFLPQKNVGNYDSNIAQSKLAKEVLAEIPAQLIGYMKANQIAPQNKQKLYPYTASTLINGTLDDINTSYVSQSDCYSDDE